MRPFTCPVCSKTFTRKIDLKCHVMSVCDQIHFICPCDTAFSREDAKLRHQMTCPKSTDCQALIDSYIPSWLASKANGMPSLSQIEANIQRGSDSGKSYDPRFRVPGNMQIIGPTQSSKTTWWSRLLKSEVTYFRDDEGNGVSFQQILYCYGSSCQPLFSNMQNMRITFHKGVSKSHWDEFFPPEQRPSLLVLDDLKRETANSDQVMDLLSKGAHHLNLFVIVISQNLYVPNMRRMEAKIDQILTFLPEMEALKVRLAKVEEENKQLRNTADSTEIELTDLKQSSASTCSQVASNSGELQKLNIEVQQLKCRNTKLEAYMRRENKKIFNLPEIAGETPADTENLVRSMFEEKMKIAKEDVDEIRFERVHRCRLDVTRTGPVSLILYIAKLSFYQDKQFVWSSVRKLKDTGIGLSHDYPKEIDEIHEKLYPLPKKAKSEKQQAFFIVDKLIINGQVYRGKETENLPYYGLIMGNTQADGEL